MSKKYKKALEEIVISEDMKKRILHNVLSENVKVKKYKIGVRSKLIIASVLAVFSVALILKSYFYILLKNGSSKVDNIAKVHRVLRKPQLKEVENNVKPKGKNDSEENKDMEKQKIIKQYVYNKNHKQRSNQEQNDNKNIKPNENNQDNNNRNKVSSNNSNNNNNNIVSSVPSVTLENNENKYKTLEEAENAVNFKISDLKNLPTGFNLSKISVLENKTIEIDYNLEKDVMKFTALKNSGALTGTYDGDKGENVLNINGVKVMLKEDKDKIVKGATWEKDNISYSISFENGIEKEKVISIISSNCGTANATDKTHAKR
ncbi:hypothetical protein [Clostridium felsineum]|uniref:hypothetical protein n=1 Tax=Clostridium felsineum TaxID=36839 RepID=UPI00098C5556|nr:hypothetical protein [Clostridium felsineum]URZ18486.1 hypothetical protein CLFE_045740 [Clostridium felsineum DSM 794]